MDIDQKIIPHLWFDDHADEAAQLYTLLFDNSKMGAVTRYTDEGYEIHGQPEGKVMTVEFTIAGHKFIGLNGGHHFSFTPAISFFVTCKRAGELQQVWDELSEDGDVLMELDTYDWSELYGWLNDRYGISWQLSLGSVEEMGQAITPSLLFVGDQDGRAENAINYYTSVFDNSEVTDILRYGADEHEREGTVKHARFSLSNQQFMAMDSSLDHNFGFNEAISFLINCETQDEIDYFWEKLSAGGDREAQQRGWLGDKFGISWQIFPVRLREMMLDQDVNKVKRVTKAYLQMKKLDIAALEEAFHGRN